MGFFSSFIGSVKSGFSGSSNSTQKKNLAEENEKNYKEAKKAFDHFFDDEKFVEVKIESKRNK